jgi:hypothetical protein
MQLKCRVAVIRRGTTIVPLSPLCQPDWHLRLSAMQLYSSVSPYWHLVGVVVQAIVLPPNSKLRNERFACHLNGIPSLDTRRVGEATRWSRDVSKLKPHSSDCRSCTASAVPTGQSLKCTGRLQTEQITAIPIVHCPLPPGRLPPATEQTPSTS